MADKKDTILVIDHDADERQMLVESALEPSGYIVQQAGDGGEGLKLIQAEAPDVVILDLHTEGLSGRDVLAAMKAQAVDLPVILLANKGAEGDALQAFRLGAMDYVVRPFREPELIQVLDRAFKEVHLKRDREKLLEEVKQAADEAKGHLRELKTLMNIGKSITTLRALDEVFERVIRAAIQLTNAEVAGFFLRDDKSEALILRAGQNLSEELAAKMGQPVSDELATIVIRSAETFVASGEGLKRYQPAQAGVTSVIYCPLVIHESAIGVLWVANATREFGSHSQDLMTALADYATISVVNARLFATMRERTRQLEQLAAGGAIAGGKSGRDPRFEQFVAQVRGPLTQILGNLNLFRTGEMGRLMTSHQAAVDVMYRQLANTIEKIDSLSPPDTAGL